MSGTARLFRLIPGFRQALVLLGFGLGLGCSTVDRFETRGEAAYCGNLVGAPFQDGFLPRASPPDLSLQLKLDTDGLRSRPEHTWITVGSLTSGGLSDGLCAAMGRPLLEAAPLRTIPELDHDPLSLLEFGEGRDYTFFAWVDSTCQGTLLAIVSLMRNENVEVRLLKSAPQPAPGAEPGQRPGFGLFHLSRNEHGCEF